MSAIEWCDETWQLVSGCTVVSEGCRFCYSARLAGTRLKNHPRTKGLTRKTADGRFVFNGVVRCHADQLDRPLGWKKPRRVFVADRGDLFHGLVPLLFVGRAWATMALAPRHDFLVLTKRPERLRVNMTEMLRAAQWFVEDIAPDAVVDAALGRLEAGPLANVWLGVSVEDQATAAERIPVLLETPAARRFISAEPLLGPVDLSRFMPCPRGGPEDCGNAPMTCCQCDDARGSNTALDWVIAGGESGPGARAMHPDWARSLRDQCRAAGVAFFFKQWGAWAPAPDAAGDSYEAHRARGARDLFLWPGGATAELLGKKRAGRRLDGREWNQVPT